MAVCSSDLPIERQSRRVIKNELSLSGLVHLLFLYFSFFNSAIFVGFRFKALRILNIHIALVAFLVIFSSGEKATATPSAYNETSNNKLISQQTTGFEKLIISELSHTDIPYQANRYFLLYNPTYSTVDLSGILIKSVLN
ncbi:MAG TPA: hypothetical protein VN192_07000, partial [Flavobacterium sp.]|nr:hypothetical protein [Flavobacterium sp.]